MTPLGEQPMVSEETVWLIEWPASDTVPVRWWNPARGWMRDANAALHFARQTDADCYLSTMKIGESLKVTEHKFVSTQAAAPGGVVDHAMVETAWSAIVGGDIAAQCFNVSIVRADLRAALEAVIPAALTSKNVGRAK